MKIDRGADSWTIEVSDGESRSQVEAKVVAGAWGRWGRFDLQLGRTFVRADHRHFGFKRHYRRTDASSRDDSIALYSFRRGYLGVGAYPVGLGAADAQTHGQRSGALIASLEDGGPAIFRQQRVGQNRSLFTLLKFRKKPLLRMMWLN